MSDPGLRGKKIEETHLKDVELLNRNVSTKVGDPGGKKREMTNT